MNFDPNPVLSREEQTERAKANRQLWEYSVNVLGNWQRKLFLDERECRVSFFTDVVKTLRRHPEIFLEEGTDSAELIAYGLDSSFTSMEKKYYTLVVTNAPPDYDYTAYNHELTQEDGLRVVACQTERIEYQLGRYASGIYFYGYYGSNNHMNYIKKS